jgi:uncharacterized protein YdhG (YjbR/CyaY superfamily)
MIGTQTAFRIFTKAPQANQPLTLYVENLSLQQQQVGAIRAHGYHLRVSQNQSVCSEVSVMAVSKVAKKSVLTSDEKTAMRELVRERKAALSKADAEKECLAKIAEMPPSDRAIAKKIHALIKANAAMLDAKTWYGMPAYARGGDIVCFFQSAGKFKARYATFGFTDKAKLDNGNVWPTYFGVAKLTPADEAKIASLVKKAVS